MYLQIETPASRDLCRASSVRPVTGVHRPASIVRRPAIRPAAVIRWPQSALRQVASCRSWHQQLVGRSSANCPPTVRYSPLSCPPLDIVCCVPPVRDTVRSHGITRPRAGPGDRHAMRRASRIEERERRPHTHTHDRPHTHPRPRKNLATPPPFSPAGPPMIPCVNGHAKFHTPTIPRRPSTP